MNKRSRGQNLVIFALTLLLMTLMVLMTLSLGMKAKSRMELQTVADSAAYSNSVATARTLNSIAVMNRVQVAHTVSTIGTLSLISWATLYWRHAMVARNIYATQAAIFALGIIAYCIPPPPRPACRPCRRGAARTLLAAGLLWLHASQVRNKLQRDTDVFQQETLPRWRASLAMFGDQNVMHQNLMAKLNTPIGSFASQYASQGDLRGVSTLTVPAGINTGEMDGAMQINGPGGQRGEQPYHAAQIVMASRGHPFIPERDSPSSWSWKLTLPWSLPAGITWVDGDDTGRGYLNQSWTSNPNAPPYGHPYGSYAHDWGDRTRTIIVFTPWIACTGFGPLAMAVGVIGRGTGNNVKVGPWEHPGIHNGVQHSFQTFPPFIDYMSASLNNSVDLYGQPKNLSVVALDPLARTDPWDLKLNFQFTVPGAKFDMTQRPAAISGGKQLAIGSGVTYYSRPDHYPEPPNLFAPFWRSTLTRMTVDRPDPGPQRAGYDATLRSMLQATGQDEAAVAFDSLTRDDYKGFE